MYNPVPTSHFDELRQIIHPMPQATSKGHENIRSPGPEEELHHVDGKKTNVVRQQHNFVSDSGSPSKEQNCFVASNLVNTF
jgi:hypothetical protein